MTSAAPWAARFVKDKLFFSSSYHYLRFNQGQTYLETVPTALERAGNFSQTLQQNPMGLPSPAQLFNPFSVTQLGNNLYQRAHFPTPSFPIRTRPPLYITASIPCPTARRTTCTTPTTSPHRGNTVRRQTLNNRIDYKLGRHSIYGNGGFDFGTILNPITGANMRPRV